MNSENLIQTTDKIATAFDGKKIRLEGKTGPRPEAGSRHHPVLCLSFPPHYKVRINWEAEEINYILL